MRILVTNDDGIHAAGIQALVEIAETLSKDVWVCAPLTQQSCMSHALTMNRPLRIHKMGGKKFAVDGTPSDAVLIGLNKILPEKPDLILSGINHGFNVGHDVTYSGTVAGAMEGTLLGIRSIALSQGMNEQYQADFAVPRHFARDIIQNLLDFDWLRLTLMNVNFPAVAVEKITGIRLTHHLDAKMSDDVIERQDTRFGEPYYWVGHSVRDAYAAEGSDVTAVTENAISVTPIKMDMTDYTMLKIMQESLGDSFKRNAA